MLKEQGKKDQDDTQKVIQKEYHQEKKRYRGQGR